MFELVYKMPTGKEINNLVNIAITAIFGFGIALFLGATLLTALGTGTQGWNAVNAILGGFSSAITTVFVPIISIFFILFLYSYVRSKGLLGGGKGTHE